MKSLDKSTHEAIRELVESDNKSRRRARFVLLARIAGGEEVPSEAEIGAIMAGLGSGGGTRLRRSDRDGRRGLSHIVAASARMNRRRRRGSIRQCR